MDIGTCGICRPRTGIDHDGHPHADWPAGTVYDFVVVRAPGTENPAGWTLVQGPTGVYSCNPTYFAAHFEVVDTIETLLEIVRNLPPPTPEQRRAQAIDFAHGNARMSNPHVTRAMTEAAFDKLDAEGKLSHLVGGARPAPTIHIIEAPPEVPEEQPKIEPGEAHRAAGGALISSGPPSLADLKSRR